MTLAKIKPKKVRRISRLRLWYERVMALFILFNFVLVMFDLTYIPLRDFWLQGRFQLAIVNINQPVNFFGVFKLEQGVALKIPPDKPWIILPSAVREFVTGWDAVKGIVPDRTTENYLREVERLQRQVENLNQQVSFFPASDDLNTNQPLIAQNKQEIEEILQNLRQDSLEIIDTNPFQIANKTGALETIKNNMRDHIKPKNDSAKQAFIDFWSKENLFKNGFFSYRDEINFFNHKIRPYVARNYFRPIGENGELLDNFGAIDFPFGSIFFVEFLVRTWFISRRYTGVAWFDAMLWRWYDVFLFLPFLRWLRIIPTTIRLSQANLINLNAIQKQASQGFVASIAEDITEVVVIRIINQFQKSIEDGAVRNFLTQQDVKRYIDINDTNETVEIIKLLTNVVIKEVLPKIQPEAEALLKYNVEKIIAQTPAYQGIKQLPGVNTLQNQLSEQLSIRIYQVFYDVLVGFIEEDPVFDQLLEQLIESFTKNMGSQLQAQNSLERLELLLTDLLEEIKLNYVQKLAEDDVEDILEQSRQLRQQTQNATIAVASRYQLK